MKICAIPLDIKYASPAENLNAAASLLSQVDTDTDVLVLPELFTTAFLPEPSDCQKFAELSDGRTISTVKKWANFFGFAIAGSFLATDGEGHYFNRAFFVEPLGDVTFYDKRHLFPLSTEDTTYTPGRQLPPRIRFRGWEFMLIVCFDLRFPVWCRNTQQRMYDVLIVPSNWPHTRIDAYHLLMAARAVENQIYTVGCNRTGSDHYGEYPRGDSLICDPRGRMIQETRSNGFLYAFMDKAIIEQGRQRFPAWKAMDTWHIDL